MRIRSYFSIFLVVCLLGSYLSVYVLLEQYSREKQADQRVNDIKLAIKDVERLTGHIRQFLVMSDLILGSGVTYLVAGANENSDLIVSDLDVMTTNPILQDLKQDFNALQTHLEDIQWAIGSSAGLNINSDASALTELLQSSDKAASSIIDIMEKIDEKLKLTDLENQAYAEEQNHLSWWVTLGVVALLSLLIIIIWLWTARNISRPMQQLSERAEKAMEDTGVFQSIGHGPFEVLQLSKKLYRLITGLEDEVLNRTKAFNQSNRQLEKETKQNSALSAWQRAVLDSADYCIISTDTNGLIATFNKKAEQMLGYSADEVVGKATPAIIHDPEEVKEYAEILSQEFNEKIDPGFEVFVRKAREGILDEREWSYVHKDGSTVPVYLSVTALRSINGEIIGFLGIASDLTELKGMLANLRETETLYHGLFNNAGDAINLLDANGIVIDCNPAALEMFGCSREEYVGRPADFFSPETQLDGESTREKANKIIHKAFSEGQHFFEWLHVKHDGTEFNVEVSLSKVEIENKPYLQGIIRDITERKRFEKKLAFQAGHDSLTGLPNRKTLHDSFSMHLKEAEKINGYVVMMLLDLDRFKDINDTLGHHIGDQVLAQVGPRLSNKCTEKNSTIARLGGDEFALIITTNSSTDQLRLLADSIVESMRLPFEAGGVKVTVGASIGVANYPQHGNDSHELLRAADVAMYAAKKRSLGVVFYDASIDEYSTQRLKIANELNQAIKNKQLVLHYQPKINIATGKISGFEALVRWNHPTEGMLFPDSFIDLVEMSEIIHPFTNLVIEIAVSDKKRLSALGFDQSVAINLSARNLIDDRCFETLEAAMASNNLSTSEVELELTESAFMYEPENAVALLNKYHSRGINTAIDDFGTGYSSLSYLRQLPVSALKIDRSFVMNMRNNTQDSAIVRSTIALAHSLDIKVIAEGVEDNDTLELLSRMECDFAQGYGICRPIPLDELILWLEKFESQIYV